MKFTLIILALLSFQVARAENKIDFNYQQKDLIQVIKDYAQASGQKFIVDPHVKGQISIFNPGQVTLDQAFNQLSAALATNGYAISKQGDTDVIQSARSTERSLIEVGTKLPPIQPERLFTWIVPLKNSKAENVLKRIRILTSKDGEIVADERTNQLLITDWVTNLHRVEKIVAGIDQHIKDRRHR